MRKLLILFICFFAITARGQLSQSAMNAFTLTNIYENQSHRITGTVLQQGFIYGNNSWMNRISDSGYISFFMPAQTYYAGARILQNDSIYRCDTTHTGVFNLGHFTFLQVLSASPSSLCWALTGNAGTTPGTNFIGTADNEALALGAGNEVSGWVDPIWPFNTFFGYHAGNSGFGNMNVAGNVFVGAGAAKNMNSGYASVVIGAGASQGSNLNNEVIIGTYAGYHVNDVGDGGYNTIIGSNAATNLYSGIGCTYIGANISIPTTARDNSMAFGEGAESDNDNEITFGNTAITNNRFSGEMSFWNSGQGAYEPGTTGQVLTSQGAGSPATWADAGGGGTPGGTSGQVQWNNSGSFAATTFTTDGSTFISPATITSIDITHRILYFNNASIDAVPSVDWQNKKLYDASDFITWGNTTSPTASTDIICKGYSDTHYVGITTANSIPAYADDASAASGGLTTGQIYQTTGAGSAPLNAAGILMVKQ